MRVDNAFNVAAFIGWLACSFPGLLDIVSGRLQGPRALLWLAAFLIFGVAYQRYLRTPYSRRPNRVPWIVLVQAVAGFVMVASAVGMTKYLCGISVTLVAGELPLVVAPRVAWTWVAVQSVLLAAIFKGTFGWMGALSGGGAFAGFQVFAIAQGLLKRSEREAQEELSRTNANLRATQELLAEASKSGERVRISRDLHDTLGHHLTALSIQLDVASRKIDGAAADDIREAHAITRLLLGDVRNVVSQLRQSGRIDLMIPLRSLGGATGGLEVRIDGPDTLMIDDANAAETVLRSVQEIITNARRHSSAHTLTIAIQSTPTGITLDARDDGHGAPKVLFGNGLTGMRERFAERAGTIEFQTAPGQGFQIHGFIPRPEAMP